MGSASTSSTLYGLEDHTIIPKTSVLRVLKGVAVATKAPENEVGLLEEMIESVAQSQEKGQKPSSDEAADIGMEQARSFTSWCQQIHENIQSSSKELGSLAQVTLAVALLRAKARSHSPLDTNTIDKIWSLIYDSIINASETALRFSVTRSAQGFLAVPLCSLLENGRIDELWRLHAWLPDGQRGVSEEVCIHAHQPFGQSWTLLGSGTDCTFDVHPTKDPSEATHAAYECCYMSESGQQSAGSSGYQTFQITSTIRNTGKLYTVKPLNQISHSRDMAYSVPGGAYHRSIVHGGKMHATLFVFDSQRGYDDEAAVLGPKDGKEWVQPRDPADLTAEGIALMVDATRKWEQESERQTQADDEDPVVLSYYRYFRGLNLLRTGRREEAMQYFNPAEGLSPGQAFTREPSQKHDGYVQQLREYGVEH